MSTRREGFDAEDIRSLPVSENKGLPSEIHLLSENPCVVQERECSVERNLLFDARNTLSELLTTMVHSLRVQVNEVSSAEANLAAFLP
jgi:hypothetical protein